MSKYNIERFLPEQEYDYLTAFREMEAGHKQSHWIWYIFPQLRGLGTSHMSKTFGIQDINEAREYLAHPVLGPRLIDITQVILNGDDDDPVYLMNGKIDAMKLRSSMTLFAEISPEGSVFHRVLDKYFGGKKDSETLRLLAGKNHDSKHNSADIPS